jgi:sigma-B regulation protein RsbU (phosphoserine phosphatase)
MENLPSVDVQTVMDAMSDGVYVCDLDRRILYWSKSAERITGWPAEEILGRRCLDGVLCHVDKDGHQLCGEEFCPLHRSMVTGRRSKQPLIVYARARDGRRIPTEVSVAPIRNAAGEVVGGVETFRDVSSVIRDLERAKAIQAFSLECDLPNDPRVGFTTHYISHDIIGGDYYAVRSLDGDRYGLMLADVTGHGIAAALYTMHLSALWDRFHHLLADPAEFAGRMNTELGKVVKDDASFAAAVCALVDVEKRVVRLAGAGGPPVLVVHPDGTHDCLNCPGFPFGVLEDAPYDEMSTEIRPGDRLLLFSDGAVEVADAAGKMLGIDGLVAMLRDRGYPDSDIQMDALEEDLLKYSDAIRLEDDLTLIEIRFTGA